MAGYGYGISVSGTRALAKAVSSAPLIPSDGLSLWLKGDAGVTTIPETYVSQVVISGAGTTTSNGTYTRASGGDTTFTGPNGNYIIKDGATEFSLWDTQLYNPDNESYGAISYITEDFQSWFNAPFGESPAPSGAVTNTLTGTLLVTGWADQSENGNNAISQSINPTFISSSINSKPAISFNNDGSWMQIPQNNIGDDGNISIFIVMNYSAGYIFLNKGDAASFEITSWELSTITGFGFVNDDGGGDFSWNTVPVSPATNTPLLLEGFSSDGVSQLAFNGINSGNPSGPNSGFNNISQYIGIGGGGDGGGNQGNPLDARIAEIIIYNRQVTTPERQQVEQYLNSKYQIYPWRIVISGAGTATSNGEYVWDGSREINGKPIYDKVGGAFDEEYIIWEIDPNNFWGLYDSVAGFTYNSQDLITWNEGPDGSSPVPSSTLYYTP